MPKSKLDSLLTIIRWIVVGVIIVGVVIIIRLNQEVTASVRPEHRRLSLMVDKLSAKDEDSVHVLMIRSGTDSPVADSKTGVRAVWKWRIQTPNNNSYSVFSCIGQIPSHGNLFTDFSSSKTRGTRVNAFSRRLECSSLSDYEVNELGPFIRLSFEFDIEANRWYTGSEFEGTMNRYPEVFQFLGDPEKFTVETQTLNQMKTYDKDEIIQLFRIRSNEVCQTKMVDGQTVEFYHGIYVFLVPIGKNQAFRESAGF